jgi:calcineurin-like phosphoesterase family protein
MIHLTSDEHHGHFRIIEYSNRPFAGIEAMENELIARHNAVVGDDDVVIHVGDFSLDEGYVPYILPKLRGKHRLVVGNHDACFHKRSKAAKFKAKYLEWGFFAVDPFLELDVPGVGFVHVSHMPYRSSEGGLGDEENRPERHADCRPIDDGRWLLHGHVHEKWKVKNRMLNVGVDVWDYAPVSLDTIAETIQKIEAQRAHFAEEARLFLPSLPDSIARSVVSDHEVFAQLLTQEGKKS